MKYIVTYVTLSRATSRRMGKAKTQVVNTKEGTLRSNRFYGLGTPLGVEEIFEHMWRDDPKEKVKVVDVRLVEGDQS